MVWEPLISTEQIFSLLPISTCKYGLGADYFDCGEGIDVVVDFNISENDDNAGNCEEIIGTETISIG
jgi:hypothetical protein